MIKKVILSIIAIILVVTVSISLVACSEKNYLAEVSSYKFWSNELKTAVPQTTVAKMVEEHLSDTAGAKPKVAVLGFDGLRADGLTSIISSGVKDKSDYDDYSGKFFDAKYSGINTIRAGGGKVYMSYAGGEKGKESQQHTSTGPGWAAITSGAWGYQNGVTNNGKTMIKNLDHKTFMLNAAEGKFGGKRYKSTFLAQWTDHHDYQYKQEIDYLAANPIIDMTYVRSGQDNEAVEKMKNAVTVGSETECDVMFGILELPDYNGHETGFGRQNPKYAVAARSTDNYFYEIIQTIQNRSSYADEDWLIILTTDHGGIKRGHGGQTPQERITFIVSNKDINNKYFSTNFNGFVDKK